MYLLFAFTYHIPVTQRWLFYHSYTAEEGLYTFLGRRQQQAVLDHNRTIRYKSMTSASRGIHTGQYPCDGWVDNLELTLLAI